MSQECVAKGFLPPIYGKGMVTLATYIVLAVRIQAMVRSYLAERAYVKKLRKATSPDITGRCGKW